MDKKEYYLELYKKVKAKEVDLESLSTEDLEVILKLFKYEIKKKTEMLNKEKDEILSIQEALKKIIK